MRKVLFLLLFLLVLGAAGISAQVRIGGDGVPNEVTILDLNADDVITNTGTKGLALPRVELADFEATLDGTTANTNGMMVYNTGGTLTAGVYFWDGSQWVAIGGDGIVADAVMDATAGGGLVKSGSGTTVSPYTLGINTGEVTSSMLQDGSVTADKLAPGAVTSANTTAVTTYVYRSIGGMGVGTTTTALLEPGCDASNTFVNISGAGNYVNYWSDDGTTAYVKKISAIGRGPDIWTFCFR